MSRYSPPGRSGPERWDRDRFDSHARDGGRGGGPALVERDRYEEHDYYAPQRQRERSAERYQQREPPRFQEYERDVYEEKDRFALPSRSRQAPPARYWEDEGNDYAGAMVPVRPRERERERDRDIEIDIRRTTDRYGPPARREPARPQFVRRQSSLDTFDRKPMPRYGDHVREETIIIPAGPRRRSPPRYHSPPRFERDYEEDIRIAEPEFYGDDEFRGYREREVERVRKRRSRETVVEEEREEIIEKEFPRRGKTRMPMRLVNRRAVLQLGYPYEEEGETLIILKALGKEHIDEVIKISKEMNAAPPKEKETRTTTYVYENDVPPTPDVIPPPAGFEEKIIERRTEIIREGGSPAPDVPRSVRDWDVMSTRTKNRSPSPASSHHSHHTRRKSGHSSRQRSHSAVSSRHEILLEERDESATVRGPIGALIVPDRDRRGSRSIKSEIKALEAEKKALRYEREAERLRGETGGGEIIIARERDDVVEVRKDKKAPNPKLIRAMLATLT